MIYVLLLEQDKIYVGLTDRPTGDRFIEHFNYSGSKWTTKYRPRQVLAFVEGGGLQEENQVTLEMMLKYGWWNVRGGSWCQVEMNSCPPALLKMQNIQLPSELKMKRSGPRNCAKCGRSSHTEDECYAKNKVSANVCKSKPDAAPKTVRSKPVANIKNPGACLKCGRMGHWAKSCFARTHKNGKILTKLK